jgi:hypothetical protein
VEDVDADTLERVKQTFVRTRETDLRNNNFRLGWNERRAQEGAAVAPQA